MTQNLLASRHYLLLANFQVLYLYIGKNKKRKEEMREYRLVRKERKK
jgi:hypothetical protein